MGEGVGLEQGLCACGAVRRQNALRGRRHRAVPRGVPAIRPRYPGVQSEAAMPLPREQSAGKAPPRSYGERSRDHSDARAQRTRTELRAVCQRQPPRSTRFAAHLVPAFQVVCQRTGQRSQTAFPSGVRCRGRRTISPGNIGVEAGAGCPPFSIEPPTTAFGAQPCPPTQSDSLTLRHPAIRHCGLFLTDPAPKHLVPLLGTVLPVPYALTSAGVRARRQVFAPLPVMVQSSLASAEGSRADLRPHQRAGLRSVNVNVKYPADPRITLPTRRFPRACCCSGRPWYRRSNHRFTLVCRSGVLLPRPTRTHGTPGVEGLGGGRDPTTGRLPRTQVAQPALPPGNRTWVPEALQHNLCYPLNSLYNPAGDAADS